MKRMRKIIHVTFWLVLTASIQADGWISLPMPDCKVNMKGMATEGKGQLEDTLKLHCLHNVEGKGKKYAGKWRCKRNILQIKCK